MVVFLGGLFFFLLLASSPLFCLSSFLYSYFPISLLMLPLSSPPWFIPSSCLLLLLPRLLDSVSPLRSFEEERNGAAFPERGIASKMKSKFLEDMNAANQTGARSAKREIDFVKAGRFQWLCVSGMG